MSLTRRRFLAGSLAAFVAGCQRPPDPTNSLLEEPALKKAARFLESKQSADGRWRSDLYGTFQDGTALTPLVSQALLAIDPACPAIAKAVKFLVDMARADGSVQPPEKHGFDYPLYTSALSVTALSHPTLSECGTARDVWLDDLRKRQLTKQHGWTSADREYGGWGYCHGFPRKPTAGELIPPMTESNLSATTFALTALKAAHVSATDPAFANALMFVKRCQNWNDDDKSRDPKCDDGGFFFIYDDPVRNKAGMAGKDATRSGRYYSYGSTTADGLRCLQMCGVSSDSARFQAAEKWLRNSFRPDQCPGPFGAKTDLGQASLYFYYAMSMAQTPLSTPSNGDWRERLADAVIARQNRDGSWANPAEAFRENDPLVATSLACIALAHCRARSR